MSTPFDKLAPLLVKAIPEAVASLKLKDPICCVRLYYYDTHAPCGYLSLLIQSKKYRDQLLAEKARDALSSLWGSSEQSRDACVDLPDETPKSKSHKQLAKQFEQVYEILCEDEDEGMVEYREMVQSVARELNAMDWSKHCAVTDDFVVAAADGSQCFCDDYEDLVNSIPEERLELLRTRGLLGPGEDWEQRPGF
jgi:hypothetical protein